MNFSYVNIEKKQIKDFKKIEKVLKLDKSVKIDCSLFPIIEDAENGCGLAMAELRDAFTDGKNGVAPSYILAKYFSKKCFHLMKDYPAFFTPENYLFSLRAEIQVDYNFKNFEKADINLVKAIKFMISNLPHQKWDFTLLELLKKRLYQ